MNRLSAAQPPALAAPFDAVASRYDETFTSSLIGQAQRAQVWKELAKTFRPGRRVLEIGCGTGVDAVFLAERGVQVVACDSSPEMIAVTARRVREQKLQRWVQPVLVRAEELARLQASERFDGAFSNFGALNCVEDHARLAHDLARLLKPGAQALLCWMGPRCLWETTWYLLRGNRDKALRRWRKGGVRAHLADQAFVKIHYPSVRSLAGAFAPEFRLESVRGIGVAVPPSYLEPWARRHPNVLKILERFDSAISRCPGIRTLADHLLVRLQRNAPASAGESASQ